MNRYLPKNISPSDIDYIIERRGKYALFEMKTDGTDVPTGQRILFESLLRDLAGKSVLFVVYHPSLDRVELPVDVTHFSIRWFENGQFVAQDYAGDQFPALIEWFVGWAEGRDMGAAA